MDFTDFSRGQAWAIVPEHFETLIRRFHAESSDMRSGKISKEMSEKLEASRKQKENDALYAVEDGIAIIPVVGPLTKRSSFWSWLFGASSYEDIRTAFDGAMNDQEVRGIVLDIDSPGGVVNGTDALSEVIYRAREEKPVVAYANGLMASAAYWIGSAAEAVIGSKTAEVGSIGVLMVHQDFSRLEDRIGVKTTYLTAGKYKALGNDAEPLSQQARDTFQAELDKIYSIFVSTVARNRDASVDDVNTDMADGRIFIGDDAAAAGLIDSVGSMENAVEMARSMVDDTGEKSYFFIPRGSAAVVVESEKTSATGGNITMADKKELKISDLTADMLRAENPDLFKSIETAARDAAEVKVKDAEDEVKGNTSRILGLAKLHFGADAGEKFEKVVLSGVTVEQYEAISALNPPSEKKVDEAGKREELLTAIEKAGDVQAGTGGDVKVAKDFRTMVAEYRAQKNCSYKDAMLAIRRAHPKAHEDYIKSVN